MRLCSLFKIRRGGRKDCDGIVDGKFTCSSPQPEKSCKDRLEPVRLMPSRSVLNLLQKLQICSPRFLAGTGGTILAGSGFSLNPCARLAMARAAASCGVMP